MTRDVKNFLSIAVLVCSSTFLTACGGGNGQTEPAPTSSVAVVASTLKLNPPVLSFTDTGLSITDGYTYNGLWTVTNDGLGWEYSLDMGATWTRGVGGTFEVKGDGPKMIWVRSIDAAGNTSNVVVVNCVLDTAAPQAVSVAAQTVGATRTLDIVGLETSARWEYSLDDRVTWWPGTGSSLGLLGNDLSKLWIRQFDIAGNASMPKAVELDQLAPSMGHEASGDPLQPSVLATTGLLTMLIHGSVVRSDADYIRWDIPMGYRLKSVKLVDYVSDDKIAFYAIQRAPVFDAGFDVNRMLVYGHMGPQDLARNVIASVPNAQLEAGAMTLWFQQTGNSPTRYAIEITLQSIN
jgi:hypothetical protein